MSRPRVWVTAILLLAGAALAEPAHTGVVVNATRLDVQRCRFPKLYDPDGEMVYPTAKLCRDATYRQGFTGYKPSLATALKDRKRVGDNPLVLQPEGLFKGDPTGGSMTISAEQAEQLEALNRQSQVLDKDKLAVVIGLSVVISDPVDGATDVPPDQVVRITFSKLLRQDTIGQLGAVTVVGADGAGIAGAVRELRQEHVVEFRPSEPFTAGARYTVKLSEAIEADCRAKLDGGFQFSFTIRSGAAASDQGG